MFINIRNITNHPVNIESLSSDIKQLIIQQKVTQRALETGDMADKKILHPKDRIRQVMENYLPIAVKKTSFLSTLLEDMETSFDNCLVYYCEEPRDSTARSQFFQKFDFFIKDYKRVKKENFDMEEEAHRADMRRKALLKAGQKSILDQAMNTTPNHAVMDNLLEKLRVGPDPEARRTRKKNMIPTRKVPTVTRAVRRVSEEHAGSRVASDYASDTDSLLEFGPDSGNLGSVTPTNVGGNAVLAARAQSMLAGLRSGKLLPPSGNEAKVQTAVGIPPVQLSNAAVSSEGVDVSSLSVLEEEDTERMSEEEVTQRTEK